MHIKPGSILATLALIIFSQFAIADKYADAKKVFEGAGESAEYFKNSYGYALFPNIGKGGIGIGGAYGDGIVFVGAVEVGKSSMTQLSIGFQFGGEVYSQIIFFQDKRAFDDFSSGNFEFGAEAKAVALTAAANAQTSTGGGSSAGASGGKNDASTVSAGYSNGMAVFTVAKGGLMYQAAITGQKFSYKAK